MDFFKRNFLFLIVFITGAAILIIEVTATRILAPYFGNTLFTISSIIGIILAALSLGYYLGGILADKYPKFSLFFFLIFVAGVFSLLIQILSQTVLKTLGYSFDMKLGPVMASLILFFLPSLILGMMSPFAIKLESLDLKEIGRVSGKVFFWSTLGSIAGSFMAGFFLIPYFGISKIIISTGWLLIIIGLLGYWFLKGDRDKSHFGKSKFPLFLILLLVFTLLSLFLPQPDSVVFQKDGLYSQIIIEETKIGGKQARVLRLDRSPEGAVFLESDDLPFEYTRYYALYEIINPQTKKALFLGGGAYATPRKLLLDQNAVEKIDVAEIEPTLYQLAKQYFRLPEDRRLVSHLTDGRRFLQETDQNYDLIFTDVYYSLYSIPIHFTTKEFFSLAKNKLSKDGFFLINVIGALEERANLFLLSEIKTFSSVFENSYFFAVRGPSEKGLQNFIFLGLKTPSRRIDFEGKQVLENEREIIRSLPAKLLNLENLDLDAALILTDDFAPIEYLTAKVLRF